MGREAMNEGLINEVGGLGTAVAKLEELIRLAEESQGGLQ